MKVEHIHTSTLPGRTLAESIAYLARVSNPANQDNDATAERLIGYLLNHRHWSPFEMFDMILEVETSRAISAQIIRHRSFSFQEFSQRYAETLFFEDIELRLQGDSKQGSGKVVNDIWSKGMLKIILYLSYAAYKRLIKLGISRETARMILPLAVQTRLYMKGSIRSWIHYIGVRTHPDTQKEHRQIAEMAKEILIQQIPQIKNHLNNE